MYINNTTYCGNQDCDNCKNNDICKWVSSRKEINSKVNEMRKDKEFCSPVQIKVICNSFEKKEEKRDGWKLTDKFNQSR